MSCRRSGIATPGRGAIRTERPRCWRPSEPGGGPRPTHRHLGDRWWYLDDRAARAGAAVHRERDQLRAALRRAECRARTSRTRFTRRSSAAVPDKVNPARPRVEGGGALPRGDRAGRFDDGPHAVHRCAASTTRSATSTRSSTSGMAEADEFYRAIQPPGLDDDRAARSSARRMPGCSWTKQFYHYSVELWLDGDPAGPEPPRERGARAATRTGGTSTTSTS